MEEEENGREKKHQAERGGRPTKEIDYRRTEAANEATANVSDRTRRKKKQT